MRLILTIIACLFASMAGLAQDSTLYKWTVTSKKTGERSYELHFKTAGAPGWTLFGANEIVSDVAASELVIADSSIEVQKTVKEEGRETQAAWSIFDNKSFKGFTGPTEFVFTINIKGQVPAQLIGAMNYTYGKGDEFYPLNPFSFTVPLEGGVATGARIRIESIDVKNPVANCGDDTTEGKGLMGIFILGFIGGLIALITPCVFPLIPLTVSFFTKRAETRGRGVRNAVTYGFFIFLIYILLSVPFHLLDNTNPEILNNISTNVWLNLVFFVIFIVFAISFFGFFEITLPGGFASKVDSKSGVGNLGGIFFMALTLAIVSFSCTGPILGSLLAGALTKNGGAIQLTFGMGGFGLGLALPFAIFAMFPGWLKSLPRSGGWLNTVKVVLGFLEVAMAIKFLSNADLVKQWGAVKREIFIGSWVIIGILTVLYLLGKIRFPHDSPVKKISPVRWAFIAFFTAFTIYIAPGVTNTKWANLGLISGFPPPLCYSMYEHPVNCEKGIEPLRDYEEALKIARAQNKPLLIDFTGWACVNCRRMEENVWTDPEVTSLMRNNFVVVSLYVDERKVLPASQQTVFTSKHTREKKIITVGDKWATFQFENFDANSQPQYAIISTDERALTRTKGYTPAAKEFKAWLECGLDAYKSSPGARK
jgi:cytochrome c biogenesis protein CcdA/thioredoxin-related protein